jgi:inhibitor of cysteine peptidase
MPKFILSENDNNRSFTMQEGDQLVIRLAESPTTGYRWSIDGEVPDALTLQDDAFSPAGSGVGGGGERIFTFFAQSHGTASLNLKLWRNWEGERSVTNRFRASITVNE